MAEESETRTFCEKIKFFLSNVTVEPVLFLAMLAGSLQGVSIVNMSLFKVCTVTLGYSADECENNSLNKTVEDQIHKLEANYSLYRSYLMHGLDVFVAIIIGSWSDQHNRKFPMILAKTGFLLSTIVFLLNAIFTRWPPEMLLLGSAIIGITGGSSAFMAIIMSYMADTSSTKHRTTRYGLLDAAHFIGAPIGHVMSGFLQEKFGFVPIFSIAGVIYAVNLLYVAVRINAITPGLRSQQNGNESAKGCKGIFRWEHFRDCWRVCTKPRERNKRMWLLLVLWANFILSIPGEGEGKVSFNFYNLHFKWNQLNYSLYISVGTAVAVVGFLFWIPLLAEKAKISDPVLEIISDVAKILNPLIIIFATRDWMVWSAQAVTMFYCFAFPAIRSLMSKLVSPEEVGKVFSVKGISESFINLFAGLMYSRIYAATLSSFPGAFLFLSIGCSVISGLTFVYIFIDMKRTLTTYTLLTEEIDPSQANNA